MAINLESTVNFLKKYVNIFLPEKNYCTARYVIELFTGETP